MRVADSYFRQLLEETEPLRAIAQLQPCWTHRSDAALPHFGLSTPEYFAQLTLIFSGEVGNGGLVQFLSNRGGRHVPDTVIALREVGLPQMADVLQEVAILFPGHRVPNAPEEAERLLASDPAICADLKELDQRVLSCSPEHVDRQLLEFLRQNREKVLVPERQRARPDRPAAG